MSLAGDALLQGFSEYIDDWFEFTTDDNGADDSKVVSSTLERFGTDNIRGGFIRITSGDADGEVRRAEDFLTDTVTVGPDFSATIVSGVTAEYHRYDPAQKFKALDAARRLAFPQLAILRINETVTADGENSEITIPSALRKGPVQVWMEEDLSVNAAWNMLGEYPTTSLTGWTAAALTATVRTRITTDTIVPRLDTACLQVDGSGTLTASATAAQAASAAGMKVSGGLWFYSRTSGATVTLVSSAGTIGTSSAHGGAGWEFLEASGNVAADNTALSLVLNTNSDLIGFVERGYLGMLERIPVHYSTLIGRRGVMRDDTVADVALRVRPTRGRQLRLIGRDLLSALGTNVASQRTNTMEVDELNADLLYATAARLLYSWEGWSTEDIDAVGKIGETVARFNEQREDGEHKYPFQSYIEVA